MAAGVNKELQTAIAGRAADYGRLTRAELDANLDSLLMDTAAKPQASELQLLLHELQVCQIELEIRNRELRDSQQQLEVARDRYANLYDFAPVGYLTLDRHGNILDINLRGATMLGRERLRLIGMPLMPLLLPGESTILADHLAQVFCLGEKVTHELKLNSAEGAPMVVRIESSAIIALEGPSTSCHAALIDITEQRQVEEALRQGGKRFRAIFEQASVGVALIDSGTGMFQIVNQKFSDIIGYPCQEMQTLDVMQITHPDDHLSDMVYLQKLMAGEIGEFATEKRLFRKDGAVVWVELTVSPMWERGDDPGYYIAIIDDITPRKQAEAVLRCHNEVLELLAGGASLDDVLYRLVVIVEEVNPNLFCAVLLQEGGYDTLRPYVTPGYWVFLDCPGTGLEFDPETGCCKAPLASPELGAVATDMALHPDCDLCHEKAKKRGVESCRSQAIFSATGEMLGLFAFYYRDEHPPKPADQEFIQGAVRLAGIAIERSRTEELARQHQSELAHMARLNMMGEMATSMAHELNQPLSAISTYTDVARRMVNGGNRYPDKLDEALRGACEQAMRASEIIRHLRQLVRKQTSQKSEIDINLLIQDVADFMQYETRKRGIKLLLELDWGLPLVVADSIQVEQVLLNLVHNSIEAFQTTTCPLQEIYLRSRSNSDGMIEVEVADSGPGISVDVADNIFDPFITTKGAAGMGMGLSICRSIIESHKGCLWVRSMPGEGASFCFTLPPREREAQE